MPKQTTAVEWLIEKLNQQKRILKDSFVEGKWNDDRCSEIDNCIDLCIAAKQLERKQIIDARESHPKQMKKLGWNVNTNDGEDYYTEKFSK